ncbi:hypothetical protein [Deinococcus marmoris]|uniref:Uncharacterized protein n=1 Tax=Deinococcus marmoris TaxID=249408 RepID=A0A1U7NSN5_9DEIO|nr:hypothetical protein [Deinococcus marmoris]OLV15926.1 hypothetical protein BOO71_0013531 [Deinococcus marmoris]
MTSLTFEHIHEAVAEAFPELARPLALLCEDEIFSTNGVPRQYSGTSMLLRYFLEVLVALPVSPHRNAALHRAFAFIERMLASPDHDLVGLAEIQLIEGQPAWWYQRALPFAGPLYQQAAGRVSGKLWTQATAPGAPPYSPEVDLHDLYEVRPAIASMLAPDGLTLEDIPDREPT